MRKLIVLMCLFSSLAQAKAPATTLNGLFWETPDPSHIETLKNQYIPSPKSVGNLGNSQCYRKINDTNKVGNVAVESIDYCYINSFLAAVFYHAHTRKDNLQQIMLTVISKYGTSDAMINKDNLHVTSWKDAYNPDYIASVQFDAMEDTIEIMEANEAVVAQSIKDSQPKKKSKKIH
jgi:hypothetical protein